MENEFINDPIVLPYLMNTNFSLLLISHTHTKDVPTKMNYNCGISLSLFTGKNVFFN